MSTTGLDEDQVSVQGNKKTSSSGAVKETLSVLQNVRKSFRRSSQVLRTKESKITETACPPSPGPGAGSPTSPGSLGSPGSPGSPGSLATSPMKRSGASSQRKEEDEPNMTSHKQKPLSRSKTDPGMSWLGGTFEKKRASFRRSMRLVSKKDYEKSNRKDPPERDLEDLTEKTEEKKEEEVFEEIDEEYTLPEIPHTPLSVMQINKLIEMEVLEEAHCNLLALRLEFQKEKKQLVEDCPMELSNKEKDLSLLYRNLRNKINIIVRDSNSLPARNKALLVLVARIIQEEEKRAEEPGGLPDSWMEAWREAVCEGVQMKVNSVHLEQREQNTSWLAVHLGLLGKTIVEDLENVKRDLRWSYPPSFNVFSTYVRSYHRVVRQHLKKLESQVTELKDLYALLDWILHKYKSEKIMRSLSLQPEMTEESADLQVEENFQKQMKEKYSSKVKEDMRTTLDRVIDLEDETFWRDGVVPEKEEKFLISPFPMDIWTKVKGTVSISRILDPELEQKVISVCIEELKNFPKRFETEFRRHCSALQTQPVWMEYQIMYINSFTALQEHMEGYQDSCRDEVEGFRREAKWLIVRLIQNLEDQFKDDIKPYLRRMMTRKWLTNDEDFTRLYQRTELLSQHCDLMRPPHVQTFADRLYYHVVREYIGQLMKNNYSCRNRKHEKAAAKIRQQWRRLRDVFEDMKSSHEWLHHVGDDLSDIIGQKNKMDIKNHLQPLVEHYPDFSRKHLVAVLHFRGLHRGREHQLILQQLTKLKKEVRSSTSPALFEDMQVTGQAVSVGSFPFSCVSFLSRDI